MRKIATFLALVAATANAFYLPGVPGAAYKEGEPLTLLANAIQSLEVEIPYDFYMKNFGLHNEERDVQTETLASALRGDRLVATDFKLNMNQNQSTCQLFATASFKSKDDVNFIRTAITEQYYYQFEVDNLPSYYRAFSDYNDSTPFLGVMVGGKGKYQDEPEEIVFYHNFFEIVIQTHPAEHMSVVTDDTGNMIQTPDQEDASSFNVVGVQIIPHSIQVTGVADAKGVVTYDCSGNLPVYELKADAADLEIPILYTVSFVPSDISFGHRWDVLLEARAHEEEAHWFNLVNSIVIMIFLTSMVGMIIMRALHKDISRYNSLEAQEDNQEEFGWKLVHGDVFRPPTRFMHLSVFLGSGAQIFVMAAVTLVFSALGVTSPASRGSILNGLIFSYALSGAIAGYISARFYKMFGGESWKKNVLMTAISVPGIVFLVFIILNFFLIGVQSSSAVPFTSMLALFLIWVCISVPLNFLGAYRGFSYPRIDNPVKTNQIPRQIPAQPTYLKTIPSVLMGGVLPFGAIFIELFYILGSIWSNQVYYLFGILFIVALILVVTCAEVTILLCYFQLCAENYQWWWRAFFTSGSSALYMFLYSLFYYVRRPYIGFVSFVLFTGWSLVVSFLFFLVTGFIGFYACWMFVRRIYGSIKID